MAGFDCTFPDDIFEKAELTDEKIKSALENSSYILEDVMKKNLSIVIKNSTEELLDSVKAREPKRNKKGIWSVFVGPTGYSKNKKNKGEKISNALKAIYIEHGNSRQHARPFLQKTINEAETKVIVDLEEKLYGR